MGEWKGNRGERSLPICAAPYRREKDVPMKNFGEDKFAKKSVQERRIPHHKLVKHNKRNANNKSTTTKFYQSSKSRSFF